MHWYMQKHPQAPKMPKRETEALLSELKELHRTATMNSADFGGRFKENPTEFIRKATQLWRKTWLICPLQRLIQRYERALNQPK